jgi:hypothetical protein
MSARIKKGETPGGSKPAAQVTPVPSRDIRDFTRLQLFVRAGGRCEFDGHNKYLLRHSVTLTDGNFGQMAHIVAFSPAGPRGGKKLSIAHVNDLANLMVLCHECHKLVDTNPDRYSVRTLKEFKKRHEDRIFRLTGAHPDHQTRAVIVQANIGRQAVGISPGQVQEAIAPRYPDGETVVIDLTAISDGDDAAYWLTAKRAIDEQCDRLYAAKVDGPPPRHLSLFALAPIPVLVYLGSRMSSKVPLDLYQRHRDTEKWRWKTTGVPVTYTLKTLRTGTDKTKVALVLSLSGTIPIEALPPGIDGSFTIYLITLASTAPHPGYLRIRQDLAAFQRVYHEALATIVRDHGFVAEVHLFPAVPAPAAVLCGREPLPKVHPALVVYDYNKAKSGFTPTIRINEP